MRFPAVTPLTTVVTMNSKIKRSRFAQNKIDYIVYGNPKAVRQMVYDFGYQVPRNIHDLAAASRQLIRLKGKEATRALVGLHPDRNAILSLEQGKEDDYCPACSHHASNGEANYCGACGHVQYTGEDGQAFIDKLVAMGLNELETYYEDLVTQSNKAPTEKQLAGQVEMAWNELRKRKEQASSEEQPAADHTGKITMRYEDGFIILTLAITAGILIGTSFKAAKHG